MPASVLHTLSHEVCLIVTVFYRHPAFYCFHQINAFESGDDLIIDLAAYPDHKIIAQLHRTNMLFGLDPMDAAVPTRWDFVRRPELLF